VGKKRRGEGKFTENHGKGNWGAGGGGVESRFPKDPGSVTSKRKEGGGLSGDGKKKRSKEEKEALQVTLAGRKLKRGGPPHIRVEAVRNFRLSAKGGEMIGRGEGWCSLREHEAKSFYFSPYRGEGGTQTDCRVSQTVPLQYVLNRTTKKGKKRQIDGEKKSASWRGGKLQHWALNAQEGEGRKRKLTDEIGQLRLGPKRYCVGPQWKGGFCHKCVLESVKVCFTL